MTLLFDHDLRIGLQGEDDLRRRDERHVEARRGHREPRLPAVARDQPEDPEGQGEGGEVDGEPQQVMPALLHRGEGDVQQRDQHEHRRQRHAHPSDDQLPLASRVEQVPLRGLPQALRRRR
ncbi:MAG: hypothetical protein IPF87_19415 [Gemmatimonadetes bacterium]|nr:hypothetical protein [Gemmatimonadota bacterium]